MLSRATRARLAQAAPFKRGAGDDVSLVAAALSQSWSSAEYIESVLRELVRKGGRAEKGRSWLLGKRRV